MKSAKILTVLTIVLMTMNVVLVYMLLNKNVQNRPPHPPRNGFKNEVIHAIGFDAEQAEAYEKLTVQHHIAMVKLEELRGEKLALRFAALSESAKVDADSLLRDLELLERQRVEFTYSHFEDVKAICRPDQIEAYRVVVKRAVQALLAPDANRGERLGPPRR